MCGRARAWVWQKKVDVKGQIFGTLFYKKKHHIQTVLDSAMDAEALKAAHREISSWFFSDMGFTSRPLPPLMTDVMTSLYRSGNSPVKNVNDRMIRDFTASLLRSASKKNAYYRWLEAYGLYACKGRVPGPGNLLKSAAEAAAFVAENPKILDFLKQYHEIPPMDLPARGGDSVKITIPDNTLKAIQPEPDLPFRFLPVGTVRLKRQDYRVYAGDREITRGFYARFLKDEPDWDPETFKGENYLTGWRKGRDYTDSPEPLASIPWDAAQAFCRWLDERRYPGDDWKVCLPDEWLWQEIARVNGRDSGARASQKNLGPLEAGSTPPGKLGLYDMEGNLWEWCANSFGDNDPYMRPSLAEKGPFAGDFLQGAVRGGSWANEQGRIKYDSRGSQPRDWSTPYLGFRPILLEKL